MLAARLATGRGAIAYRKSEMMRSGVSVSDPVTGGGWYAELGVYPEVPPR